MWQGLILVGLTLAGLLQPAVAQHPLPLGPAMGVASAPRLRFSAEEMALAQAVAPMPDLAAFYGTYGQRPLFDGAQGAMRRQALARAVATAPAHGIPPERYRVRPIPGVPTALAEEIGQARVLARYLRDMTGGVVAPSAVDPLIRREVRRPPIPDLMRDFAAADDPAGFLEGLQPRHPAYRALQKALSSGGDPRVSAALPRIREGVWRAGMRDDAVPALRARLDSAGFAAPATDPATGPAADPRLYDTALADAVARYQSAVGLAPDGIAGPRTIGRLNGDTSEGDRTRAIVVALERMRWMGSDDLDARHVWVNIPEFSARIMQDGAELFRTRVVVGSTEPDRQTPEFSDEIEYVVANPRWNVPRSITVKEYLPKLQANRYAVSHLDVVDGNGTVIARDRIDFGRYTAATFPYRMRQQPSGDNALGLVKFIFPNPWNIYLHDTPTKHLFQNASRAYSHGCIRIGDPFDLAYHLLSGQTDDPRGMFHRALDRGSEAWLKLTPAVPVHLVYFTAFPDAAGTIRRFDDIYGRDALIYDAILKAGLE